eukprot:8629020-Pyramimonas_sp.AAC.2
MQEEQAGQAGEAGTTGEEGQDRPRDRLERLGESGLGQLIAQILLQGMGDAPGGVSYEQLIALQERMGGSGKVQHLNMKSV